MNNQVQNGDAIYVASTLQPVNGFISGTAYAIGAALFGVAGASTKDSVTGVVATGVLWLVGVFNLPKMTNETWAVGDIIYWSPTNQKCTKTNSSSDLKIGVAVAAVGTASTPTGTVRLNGTV